MDSKISRRNALAAGTAAGLSLGAACSPVKEETAQETGPGREEHWGPGKDMSIPKKITIGKTPVRLGAYLNPQTANKFIGDPDGLIESFSAQGQTALVVPGEFLLPLKSSEISGFNAVLKKYDVIVSAVMGNRYTNFIHPDLSFRQQYLKNLARYMELAESVNCPAVPTICGTLAPETPEGATFQELFTKEYRYSMHPDNWSLSTWKLLVKNIRQVLNDTSGMKVSIAMEAQVTTTIDGPLAHRRLIDDVGNSRLGVEFDPVNMISIDNFYYTTELLNESFDLLGESILTCHAKDTTIWPNTQTVHVQEVCPGRGVMDYTTYFALMSNFDWPRMLLPEHIPADQFPEAYAYLRKMAAETGVELYG
ncbi:TIM barrel protein [Candidatus Latescibacterota bacterium]